MTGTPRLGTTASVLAALVLGLSTVAVAAGLDAPDASVEASTTPATTPAPECPDVVPLHDDAWVPQQATFDGASEGLAPAHAASGVVCLYSPDGVLQDPGEGPAERAAPLRGERVLDADLADAVATTLHDVPYDHAGVCTAMAVDEVANLIGLRTEDGTTTWVRTGAHCQDATNGRFSTSASLGLTLGSLLYGGTLGDTPAATDPCQPGTGRRGQSVEVVPGEPVSLTVCVDAAVVEVTDPDLVRRLADELRSLDLVPGSHTCTVTGESTGPTYALRFHYDEGPDAWVRALPGCSPSVSVPGSQAELSPRLLELLQEAVRTPVGADLAGPGASQEAGGPAALACPTALPSLDPSWVPAQPDFRDGAVALTPPTARSGVVCVYSRAGGVEPGDGDGTAVLAGERAFGPELAGRTARTLSYVPLDVGNGCFAVALDQVPSLIGLRTESGSTTWVRTGDPCTDATNGVFATRAELGSLAQGLLQHGYVPPQLSGGGSCELAPGRRGQAVDLVPDAPTAVTVCDGPTIRVLTEPRAVEELADAVRELPRRPDTDSCSRTGQPPGEVYVLHFHSAVGPDAWVRVHVGCSPPVMVPGSQAETTPRLLELLREVTSG